MQETATRSAAAIKSITILYFVIAISEVMAELFNYKPLIVVLKPMMPVVLMILYWYSSCKRHVLFFLAMFFSMVTNILFIPDDPAMLFLGLIAFTFHRIFVIIFIMHFI